MQMHLVFVVFFLKDHHFFIGVLENIPDSGNLSEFAIIFIDFPKPLSPHALIRFIPLKGRVIFVSEIFSLKNKKT